MMTWFRFDQSGPVLLAIAIGGAMVFICASALGY